MSFSDGSNLSTSCTCHILTTEPHALAFWHEEILRLGRFLEESTGQKIDRDHLRFQIRMHNRIRKLVRRISRFQAAERIPLSGLGYDDRDGDEELFRLPGKIS